MEYLTIPEKMRKHRILINNGINDPVIANRMATVGYTPEVMQKAKVKLHEVEDAVRLNQSEQGEYEESLEQRQKAKDEFHDLYIRDLEFARIALRNQPEVLSRIDASGTREKGHANYLAQARNFYSSLAEEESLLSAMAVFGYTAEMINARLADIDKLYGLVEQVEREEGDAQHQIKIRDQKLDELDDWASIYKQVARLVFENEPQYLEKLGIVVKS
jgi:DNA mismatch repair ATPase MutS